MSKYMIFFTMIIPFTLFGQTLPGEIESTDDQQVENNISTENIENNYHRKPIDLITFPNANEAILGFRYFSSNTEYNWEYIFQNYSENETKSSGLDYLAAYAFNDKWAAQVSFEQLLSRTSTTTYGPASSTPAPGTISKTKSEGFNDPSFRLVYRAMDISEHRYDMNISVSYSPKVQDSEIGNSNKKGNNAKGGSSLAGSIEWGRRDVNYSWSAGLEFLNFGEAEAKLISSGDKVKSTSYNAFSATGSFQWLITSGLTFQLDLAIASNGDFEVISQNGNRVKYEGSTNVGLGGSGHILLVPDTYLSLGVQSVALGERTVTLASGDELNSMDRSKLSVSASILTQF